MVKRIILILMLSMIVISTTSNVHAGLLDTIISQGNSFAGSDMGFGTSISNFISNDIKNAVASVGYLVFAAITVILGAKYIWSSADGKAEVMESLPGFVVAIIFFYLGDQLVTFIGGSSVLGGIGDWSTLAGKIIGTINAVVHYAAFGGLLFVGVKYMFASAEGKSQLKTSFGGLIIGMIFVFMASKVVDFIISAADTVI